MDLNISDEEKEICQVIKEIAQKSLNDNVYADDTNGRFSVEKWKACCQSDIFCLPISEEYGGMDKSVMTTALAVKSLSSACHDEGLVFSVCAHLCTCLIPISIFGTDEQKREYLPKLISGAYIGGNGSTEANAGSDLSVMKTRVEKEEHGYLLNGAKIFVTNGPLADLLIIYAKHSGGMKFANISAFLVKNSNPGMSVGQVWDKMGIRSSLLSEIILDDCTVSRDALLGRACFGLSVFNHSMLWERVIMAAYHIGAMELQYNTVLEYSRHRKQFNKRIIEFDAISDKIVKMRMNIEAATMLLYKTCWKFDNNQMNIADASMLKLFASEAKVENSLNAVQIFGAYGYMKESLVEKQMRDSIASKIYSGTSEIQKKLIVENIGTIND